MQNRQTLLDRLEKKSAFSVVVIGGGINGIGLYRELALQGIDVLLVEREDFCAGASSALSRMIHGGLRYLENAEYELVRESLRERNRLLKNAPHYVSPLATTIPIYSWFDGVWGSAMRFFGWSDKPCNRGALVIKMGLWFYDVLTSSERVMPKHRFNSAKKTAASWLGINADLVCSATYYDAWISHPERLGLEMILDVQEQSNSALALNYMTLESSEGAALQLKDSRTGQCFSIAGQVVVNAAGPWIDLTNQKMQHQSQVIGGTKGSHLIINNGALLAALDDHMIYYENKEGRVCILFPYFGNVLVGSTDIKVESPKGVTCTEQEHRYILESLAGVFPDIEIQPQDVVFSFSGVRPLPSSKTATNGQISRNHSIHIQPPDQHRPYPVYSMIGGKWTTFRAFAEQVSDKLLVELDREKISSSQNLSIGGGKYYPNDQSQKDSWLAEFSEQSKLSLNRAETLFQRYGTRARLLQEYCDDTDRPLEHHSQYSLGEIQFLITEERVETLLDILLRRTSLAISGELNLAMIEEINQILSKLKGWDQLKTDAELAGALTFLEKNHGLEQMTLSNRPSYGEIKNV
ncbi:MAG: glycerol-3-phosphate dehydrogenase/oxidase [Oceanospirillaceae bacterium]|nr:glycerol-3-phosphate dehydrogenase/oxidase [Oceanospirillaceae bacterium]